MEEENKINPNSDDNTDNNFENSMFSMDNSSVFDNSSTENNEIEVNKLEESKDEIVVDIEEVNQENINKTFEENTTNTTDNLITVRPVKFEEFKDNSVNRSIKRNLDIMQDIPMHITVEIGKTTSSIKEVMSFKEGSVVELDKIAGEQVEIYANNKLVARGEVIVIEDRFGVRITTTNLPKLEEKD